MSYLLLAILFSSSIALVFKYTGKHDYDRNVITIINYVTATFSSCLILLWEKFDINNIDFWNGITEFASLDFLEVGFSSISGSFVWALVIGVMTGVLFYASFIFYQISVKENGAALSGMGMKIGILIPMLISLFIFNEIPTGLQWFGITLSMIAIISSNFEKGMNTTNIRKSLIMLFLVGGLAEFSNKLYQQYGLLEVKSSFLVFVFFTALIVSLSVGYKSLNLMDLRHLIAGMLVGIPNMLTSFFIILALSKLPTSVVFSAYSAGTVAFISLMSRLIYKEKLTQKNMTAIVLSVVALVLINL